MRSSGLVAAGFWLLLAALLSPSSSWACSAFGVRPSNFELVQIADAIVVAEPLSVRTTVRETRPWSTHLPLEDEERAPVTLEDAMGGEPILQVRVQEALKGSAAGEIEVEGLQIGATWPSYSGQIRFSHPEGHMGPCIRTTLAKGKPYLLFLTQRDGKYSIVGSAFSRVSEDYAGERSLWSRTVRTYLAVQREHGPMAQIAELESLKAGTKNKLWRTRFDRALARDIDDHLGSISEWKPTPYLIRAYEDQSAGRPPRYPDRDPSFDAEGGGFGPTPAIYAGAVAVLTLLLFVLILIGRVAIVLVRRLRKHSARVWTRRFTIASIVSAVAISGSVVLALHFSREIMIERMEREYGDPPLTPAQMSEVRRGRILYALVEGEHPEALPLFERLSGPGASAEELAVAIRFLAKNGHFPKAYSLIETRAPKAMELATEQEFFSLAYAISYAVGDPAYGDEKPRWQQDPASSERWPELALKLTLLGEERFGRSPNFSETLEARLEKEYRANPDLTFAMSGYRRDITEWAVAELQRSDNLRAASGSSGGTEKDPLLLPLMITIRWHGVGNDEASENDAIANVFCLSSAQRKSVFKLWGKWGGTNYGSSIYRLAASPSVNAAERQVLATAANNWFRRVKLDIREDWLADNPEGQKMVRGEPLTAKDIEPLKPVICSPSKG